MSRLTDEEIAELRRLHAAATKPPQDRGGPADSFLNAAGRNALPRLLDEIEDRRARYGDHLAVMEIAHKDGTAAREWIRRAAELLTEARRLIWHVRPDYCDATCPSDKSIHEATCAEMQEWLDDADAALGPVPPTWTKRPGR